MDFDLSLKLDVNTSYYFATKESLSEYIKLIGKKNGFVIVIVRSDLRKIVFGCHRGGSYRNSHHLTTETRVRKRNTKKINCPYQLFARFRSNNVWELKPINITHNHECNHFETESLPLQSSLSFDDTHNAHTTQEMLENDASNSAEELNEFANSDIEIGTSDNEENKRRNLLISSNNASENSAGNHTDTYNGNERGFIDNSDASCMNSSTAEINTSLGASGITSSSNAGNFNGNGRGFMEMSDGGTSGTGASFGTNGIGNAGNLNGRVFMEGSDPSNFLYMNQANHYMNTRDELGQTNNLYLLPNQSQTLNLQKKQTESQEYQHPQHLHMVSTSLKQQFQGLLPTFHTKNELQDFVVQNGLTHGYVVVIVRSDKKKVVFGCDRGGKNCESWNDITSIEKAYSS